jgi:Trypsin-co-occurring domain 2
MAKQERAPQFDPDQELGLSDLVLRIREELENVDSERRARSEKALLALEGVDLELQFTLVRKRDGQAGVDLKVVSLEGSRALEASAVHKVSVRFSVDAEARSTGLIGSRAHSSRHGAATAKPGLTPIDDPE